MEEFIGTIKAFAFNFAPRGWAQCNGQLLPISQNTALFSLIGTTYGGDGKTTFALPDLRGRTSLHEGMGPGLSNRALGSKGGTETNTLTVSEMPAHTHLVDFNNQQVSARLALPVSNSPGTTDQSSTNILANHSNAYTDSSRANATLAGATAPVSGSLQTGSQGGSIPVNNMQPFLTINYCICLAGVFPPRN
ncbi:MAG: phage tail protein [Sinomicrobium sp.]|nr:phage tail protein [Sinomicrobium sp.]